MQEVLHGPELRAQWEERLHRILLATVRAEKNIVLAEIIAADRYLWPGVQQQRDAFNALSDKLYAIGSVEGRNGSTCCAPGSSAIPPCRTASAIWYGRGRPMTPKALSARGGAAARADHGSAVRRSCQLNQKFVQDAEASAASQYHNARYTLIGVVMLCC